MKQAKNKCPVCDKEIDPVEIYCDDCWEKLKDKDHSQPSKKRKRKNSIDDYLPHGGSPQRFH